MKEYSLKATELRIGNYYKSGQTAAVPKEWSREEWKSRRNELDFKDNIVHLKEEDLKSKGFWSAFNMGWIDGVPLTEEWLKNKFGAKYYNTFFLLKGYVIWWDKRDKFWIEVGGGKIVELPYVHTLQNFFTITGEELTTK